MTINLTLSHKLAANSLYVQNLCEQEITLALDLIASIKTSGKLNQPYHLKDREEAELIQLAQDGYPLLGIKNCEGKLISFATVSKISEHDDTLIIRSLCTSPDYNGHGCGGKIIDAAMAWMRENGNTQIKAKVAADNQASLALFSKAGFSKADLQWDAKDHYSYYMMEKKAAPKQGYEVAFAPQTHDYI